VQQSSIAIADEYWAADFGCDLAALRPSAPRVQQHAGRLSGYAGASILTLTAAALVSVPGSLLDAVALRAEQFVEAAVRDPERLRRLLSPGVVTKLIGPALLHYADRSCFVPIASEDTRQLTTADGSAFRDLEAACLANDWEPKGFSLDSEASFGAFAPGGELMAVAGIEVWAGRIAHLSVVAHPGSRNRGFGSRAVAAATERAIEMGLLPQYRVLEDNVASRGIAHKLGFQGYGYSMAARLAQA
jgi:GNAT superfamily N-acetyltransferase